MGILLDNLFKDYERVKLEHISTIPSKIDRRDRSDILMR